MRLHGREVDEPLGRRAASACQSLNEIKPDAFGGPADIAIIECLAWPVVRRGVDPSSAGFQNMDDAADQQASGDGCVGAAMASGSFVFASSMAAIRRAGFAAPPRCGGAHWQARPAGSTLLSFAVVISVAMASARSAPRRAMPPSHGEAAQRALRGIVRQAGTAVIGDSYRAAPAP